MKPVLSALFFIACIGIAATSQAQLTTIPDGGNNKANVEKIIKTLAEGKDVN